MIIKNITMGEDDYNGFKKTQLELSIWKSMWMLKQQKVLETVTVVKLEKLLEFSENNVHD